MNGQPQPKNDGGNGAIALRLSARARRLVNRGALGEPASYAVVDTSAARGCYVVARQCGNWQDRNDINGMAGQNQ